MSRRCISMALHDFYQQHDNYTTRIVPHFRNSRQDNVEAASAAIDLLKNEQVMAILGPTTSSQADFVIDIGNKSSVPIISPATSPSLSPNDTPYFIRSSHDSSSQLKPIAELIKHFGWREVVFIYEDGDYGRGLIPYISNALVNVDARIMYRTVIHHSASDDWILKELYKMKTMQTRVFIVHALPNLATRFFKKVNEAGMMEEGYAWIITEVLTSLLHCLDHSDIDSMQGVLEFFKDPIIRSRMICEEESCEERMKYGVSFGDKDGLVAGEIIGTLDLLPMSITKSACEDVVGPRIAMTCSFFNRSIAAEAASTLSCLESRNDVITQILYLPGVKSHIPRTNELIEFQQRWIRNQNPEGEMTELDMFGYWWYDTVSALAIALEKVQSDTIINSSTTFKRKQSSTTDLEAIGTSEMGPRLLPLIRNTKHSGLSGVFHLIDGQLQPSVYEIVNIIGKGEKHIGYWSPRNGVIKKLHQTNATKNDLGTIIWPGDTPFSPKGWEMPTSNESKLRVGVPAKSGFVQFIDANIDPKTKQVISVTGFCVDVFNAVIEALPYAVKTEFIPFVTPDGTRAAGTYNDLLRNLSNGKYDAVAGDITILADRAKYVDFTLPYTEAGFSMIVPIKVDDRKSPWIFMRPLETNLWITIGAFFIYTGLVVWVVEHRVNKEFRGPPRQQVGMIFWFSFSTLVFAHREKLISNLSRFVVIVWVFVVLVLTSSYTASLTSILTVQKLQPAYTDIDKIKSNGESVGYQDGTFVRDKLIEMGFQESKIKNYSTFEQYDEALAQGSQKGGVSAIMDGVPYIKVFLAKYCTKYTMTGPIYKTTGFGFAFQKGSPLVADVSRAVLQVTEEQMRNISNQWFGEPTSCDQQKEASLTSD
ncbi:glutamate receptor 2.8-like protein, partial [Tanacetum coccineum]